MSNKNIFPIAIKFITFNITSHTLKEKFKPLFGFTILYFPTYFPQFFNRKIKKEIQKAYLFFT